MSDTVFPVPHIERSKDVYRDQPAIQRHYLVIKRAMESNDAYTVGNRQLRLLHAGLEIPITLEQVNQYLEKYRAT